MQVVAVAAERGMGSDVHGQIQVARRTAADAGVSLPRHANAFSVADTGWNLHGYRLGARLLSGPTTAIARPRTLLPRPDACRAAPREDHVPAHGPDGAAALTLRALAGTDPRQSRSRAAAAAFPTRDGRCPFRSRQGVGEGDMDLLVQIRATLLGPAAAAAFGEHLRKEVPERRRMIGAARREVEPFEAAPRAIVAGLESQTGVVARPPLRIHQDFVGVQDLPEARFRHAVTRIDVRMEPPRQAA